MWEFLNLAFSSMLLTIVVWAIYLPLAWLGRERFFFNLMLKERKGRQYWLDFFPTFLKREFKAALAFFTLLMTIAVVQSVMERG